MSVSSRSKLVLATLLVCVVFAPVVVHGAVRPALTPQFAGVVRGAVGGAPIPDVEVRLYDWQMLSSGATKAAALITQTVTAADGSWGVLNLQDRPYSIAFCDKTGTYRDVTFPQRGLRVEDAFGINPTTWTNPVDCRMTTLPALQAGRVRRIAGSDRYASSLKISQTNFASADMAIVVGGEALADALSAAPIAGGNSCPMLLTPPRSVTPELLAELARLGVRHVYIVGGTGSVSSAVESQLRDAVGSVYRFAGADRYATSAMVAEFMVGAGYALEPFICRGDVFSDSVSVSPFSYMEGRPVLLTRPDRLPTSVAGAWRRIAARCGQTVIVIGGSGSVSMNVLYGLAVNTPNYDLRYARLYGPDRYTTCRAVINAYQGDTYKFDMIGLASGTTFPEALVGGTAIGYQYGPLVLTPPTSLTTVPRSILTKNGPYVVDVQVYGSSGVVSNSTLASARSALGTQFYDIDAASGRVTASSMTSLPRSLRPAWQVEPSGPAASKRTRAKLNIKRLSLQRVTAP